MADSSGRVVTGSSAPVTFSISGPGTIVAVDSGGQTQESFRGSIRKAYQGVAYALVRATGPGTITVTAAAGGPTLGTTALTGTTAPFVPCSGSCDSSLDRPPPTAAAGPQRAGPASHAVGPHPPDAVRVGQAWGRGRW